MGWLYCVVAGLLEIAWVVGLKYSDGFTRLYPSLITIILMILSMVLLALAFRTLPIGTAYAVWVGIGTVGTVIIGMLYWNESADLIRIMCIALIVMGIVGLKLTSS